jgi:TIR domain
VHVRCWFAPEDLKIGERFRPKIDEAIRLHDKLLLVLSNSSVASPWVETEVESAFEREHKEGRTVLFPIRLDNAVMETHTAWAADIRRRRHIGDFSEWIDDDSYQKEFARLLRDLKAEDKADKKEGV